MSRSGAEKNSLPFWFSRRVLPHQRPREQRGLCTCLREVKKETSVFSEKHLRLLIQVVVGARLRGPGPSVTAKNKYNPQKLWRESFSFWQYT